MIDLNMFGSIDVKIAGPWSGTTRNTSSTNWSISTNQHTLGRNSPIQIFVIMNIGLITFYLDTVKSGITAIHGVYEQ